MFNLFKTKKITIPIDNAQSVTILESWTVEWTSYKDPFGNYAHSVFNAKVFIVEKEADEFIKQLGEASKFINSYVAYTKKKN